jgi:hypothetical protein
MMQQLTTVSEPASALPRGGDVSVDSGGVESLLLRYAELSQDVARLRHLLEDLVQHVASRRVEKSLRSKRVSRKLSDHIEFHSQGALTRPSRRLRANNDNTRPVRSRLERACLIALMETSEPVPVETIYDRIERRGSFAFDRYKYPFRAIMLAMGALIRRGEAILSNEEGLRRWRWEPKRTSLERPASV